MVTIGSGAVSALAASRRRGDRVVADAPLEVVGEDRLGSGILDDETCLRLLADEPVGRLGFVSAGRPVILPVNHLVADRSLVFCSQPGQKLRAATAGSPACFEVDQFDAFWRTGWSVLASGTLDVVPPERVEELRALGLSPWVGGSSASFLELRIFDLSGRSVGSD